MRVGGTTELLRKLQKEQAQLNVVWAPEDRYVADVYIRGYREALEAGCDWIIETDDDNISCDDFWGQRSVDQCVKVVERAGWVNVYRYFTEADIWRSFIAPRIAWDNGWWFFFDEPTMRQERNVHDLMRDFADEVPGYLHNSRLCRELEGLWLASGADNISVNLRLCYEKLVEMSLLDSKELDLVDAWNDDLAQIRK